MFETVGNIVSGGIVYDRTGRSEGQAKLTYRSPSEAEAAVAQYDGVLFDGMSPDPTMSRSLFDVFIRFFLMRSFLRPTHERQIGDGRPTSGCVWFPKPHYPQFHHHW